jgi:hypothetical protein
LNWILELFRQYCMICFSFLLKSTFSKNSRKIIFVPFSFGHCMVNPSSTLRIFDIFKHFLYLMQHIISKYRSSNKINILYKNCKITQFIWPITVSSNYITYVIHKLS